MHLEGLTVQRPDHRSQLPSPKDYSKGEGLAELRAFHSPEARLQRTCEIGALACGHLFAAFREAGNTKEADTFAELMTILSYAQDLKLQEMHDGRKYVPRLNKMRRTFEYDDETGTITITLEKPLPIGGNMYECEDVIAAGTITIGPEAIEARGILQTYTAQEGAHQTESIDLILATSQPDLPHDDPGLWATQFATIDSDTYAGGGREKVQLWTASGQRNRNPGIYSLDKDPSVSETHYDLGPKPPAPQMHYAQEPQFSHVVQPPTSQRAVRHKAS